MFRSIFITLMLICNVAWAGQMSSHDYTAVLAKDGLTGTALKAVTTNEDAYLSGAQGPDTTGVVQFTFDSASLHRSVGDETHYDKQKAELAVNILDSAGKNPARIAFAIGWISHYINDIYVHKVVNNYGGYFKFYARHHKVLEQLETKYIMAKYPQIENFTRSHVQYDKQGARFADFIFDAYHATYPKNEWYDQANVRWKDTADKRAYFCSRFNEAAGWSYSAHSEFYRSATYKEAGGKHRYLSGGIVFPNMPSFTDYNKYLNAIVITGVKAAKDKLTCTVKLNDNRLYGRFLADWQAAADKAVIDTRAIYPLISAYLDQNKATSKAALRERLLKAVPSESLDNPLEEVKPDSDFQPPKVFPGDQSYRSPLYTCVFTPVKAKGSGSTVSGTAPAMTIKTVGWEGSEDGETKLEITVPRGVYPYKFNLKVAVAKRDDFANPAYLNKSWAQATGQSSTEKAAPAIACWVLSNTTTIPAHFDETRNVNNTTSTQQTIEDASISPSGGTTMYRCIYKVPPPGNVNFSQDYTFSFTHGWTTPPSNLVPGKTLSLTVTVADNGSKSTGDQWDIRHMSGSTYVSVGVMGASVTATFDPRRTDVLKKDSKTLTATIPPYIGKDLLIAFSATQANRASGGIYYTYKWQEPKKR